MGVSDAPNRVLVACGLHQYRRRGSGGGGPAAALPLRVLIAGKYKVDNTKKKKKDSAVSGPKLIESSPRSPTGLPCHGCGSGLFFTKTEPQPQHIAIAVVLGTNQPWHR